MIPAIVQHVSVAVPIAAFSCCVTEHNYCLVNSGSGSETGTESGPAQMGSPTNKTPTAVTVVVRQHEPVVLGSV